MGVELIHRIVEHQLPMIAVLYRGHRFTSYMLLSLHEEIGSDKRLTVWRRNVAWRVASLFVTHCYVQHISGIESRIFE